MAAKKQTETIEVEPGGHGRDGLGSMLMLVAAAAAVAGFGVLFSVWWKTGPPDKFETMRIASQEFVGGRRVVAGELADKVELDRENEEDADLILLRDFLVGSGAIARAEQEEDLSERRRLIHAAIPSLESAAATGFPPGRQAEGNRMLGEALFNIGRFDEASESLQTAISRDLILEKTLLPKLAEAQLHSVQPSLEEALATIEKYLSDPTLKPQQQRAGQLIRIKTLMKLRQWSEASTAINDALAQSGSQLAIQANEADFLDRVKLLRAILKIQRAIERYGSRPVDDMDNRVAAIKDLSGTMQELADLQREAMPTVGAQARLWAARGYLCEGMSDQALTQLTTVRQQRPFGAEAVVGGLEEIELLAEQGRGVEVLQTTRYVMRELGDSKGFDASLVSFDEFRRRLGGAIERLRRHGEFANTIDIARSLPPVFDRSDALIQEGIGYQEWAAATIADGTDIGGEVARSAAILARSRYRAAGDAFAEAAGLEFNTEQYLPTQWSAIDAYQRGRHFRLSIEMLEPYLRYEQRRRQPRGLVAYGRALLADGDAEKAIKALTDCIVEFPRDPLRYDARLLAALAHAEQGNLDDARTLLTDNLQDGELTPQSPSWRDSLFTLGELLYRRGYENHLSIDKVADDEKMVILRDNQPILEDAIRHLDEAVERYWPAQRAAHAAYLSARMHVMSAELPRRESMSPDVTRQRHRLETKADNELQTGLEGFAVLRKHLEDREEEHRLPDDEQATLRNCYLAEADTLREMQRLEEAATAYRAMSLRYMNEPPALEAILGQARCVKDLGRTRESQLLIRQAGVVLQRIPTEWDDHFASITRYDRGGWEKLLTWMNDRIDNANGV